MSEHEMNERDHKKLGRELDLFTFSDTVGKGLPLFTEKGAAIYRELERFVIDEEIKRGYVHVKTPDIAKLDLYKKSGHYPHYKDSMYAPIVIDDEEFMLRPMTCPHHFELFLSRPRSYRELPMRIAELAQLYRYEQSGELMGLQRVRTFCLADAHIVCATEEQAADEVGKALDLIEYIASVFGLINESIRKG
jgi:threonyl-tRNA synthetase